GIVLAGFLGAWLPWAIVGRVTFAQYFLPAVPFGVLAVAAALDDARRRLRGGAWLQSGYAALAFAAFVYFYPIWSGWPVAASKLAGARWFWFASWR
ncbi:MAG TPA: phospholipid carrier-dependent glycosyltransferase, partial [Polyangia bacterium]|nr:phospholipid carrier-dependent glycosyltransferase [Polyangia bacterium]